MSLSVANELPRFGLKGRAAAIGWRTRIALPPQPNTCWRWQIRTVCCDWAAANFCWKVMQPSGWSPPADGQPDLYRVPRYDAAFVLAGEKVTVLLQEICTARHRAASHGGTGADDAGRRISVTLVCETNSAAPVYRLWCDATYATA